MTDSPEIRPRGSGRWVRVALPLVALVWLVWARVAFFGETWVRSDYLKRFVPASMLVASAFHAGRLPQWIDAFDLGVDAAANPSFQLFYPPGWIRAVVDGHLACDLLLIAHLSSLAVATGFLALRFGATKVGAVTAGASVALSGCFTSTIPFADVVACASWLTWSLVLADALAAADTVVCRARAAFALAITLAMLDLAGEPTMLIAGPVAVACLITARARRGGPLAQGLTFAFGATIVAVGLSAASLVPTLAFLRLSNRADAIPIADATFWSMHPIQLVESIFPRWLGTFGDEATALGSVLANTGNPATGMPPSWAAGYLSAPVVVLAAAGIARARRGRALGVIVLLFVLVALGRYTPVYAVYRALMLPERFVRYPHKYVVGAVVLVGALAGAGHATIFGARPPRVVRPLSIVLLALLTVGALAAHATDASALVAGGGPLPRTLDVPAALAQREVGAWTALGVTAAFFLLTELARRGTHPMAMGMLALGLIATHLAHEATRIEPTATRAAVHRPASLLAPVAGSALRLHGRRPRLFRESGLPARSMLDSPQDLVIDWRATAQPNLAVEEGLAYVPAYESAHSGAFAELLEADGAGDANQVLSMLAVRWVVLPSAYGAPAGMREAARTDIAHGFTLFHNDRARPRAFVATDWDAVPDIAAAERALVLRGRNPSSVMLVRNESAKGPPKVPGPLVPCLSSSGDPEHVEMECTAATESWAVLLDAWAPGWTAHVDGEPAEIEIADGVARAIAISPGHHRILFEYRAPGLRLGMAISAVTALGLLIGGLFLRRRAPCLAPRLTPRSPA